MSLILQVTNMLLTADYKPLITNNKLNAYIWLFSHSIFSDNRINGWLGFKGILSTQVAAISCLRKFKFVSKANGVYKRDYVFRMNVTEEIFEIRSCIEILANDIEVRYN